MIRIVPHSFVRLVENVFGLLLRATPGSFQRAYGRQIRRDFKDALGDEEAARGNARAFAFALAACADLTATALLEHAAMISRDLAFVLRLMRKSPLFSLVVVATLALAIGANATAFSILRAVVLAPLPYPQSDRLIALNGTIGGMAVPAITSSDLAAFATQNRTLRAIAGANDSTAVLSSRGRVRRIIGVDATQGLFAVLGVLPELGRFFTDADTHRGSSPAIILSDAFWRQRFGADPKIVGAQMRLDGVASTIVGIAPRGLEQLETTGDFTKPDFWRVVPLTPPDPREIRLMQGIERLRDGVTLAAARADVQTIHARLAARYRKPSPLVKTSPLVGGAVRIVPLHDAVVADARPFLFAMFAAVTGVLLVAARTLRTCC